MKSGEILNEMQNWPKLVVAGVFRRRRHEQQPGKAVAKIQIHGDL
jgi:hypothetical protein